MPRALIVGLLLGTGGLAPLSLRAQSSTTAFPAPPAAYQYSTASIEQRSLKEWRLLDTSSEASKDYVLNEKGKPRTWQSQADVLNFLAQQGWEIVPIGLDPAPALDLFYYLLRRPTC